MAQAGTNGGRLEMTQVLDCFAQDAVTPEEMEGFTPDWKSGEFRFFRMRAQRLREMRDCFWRMRMIQMRQYLT